MRSKKHRNEILFSKGWFYSQDFKERVTTIHTISIDTFLFIFSNPRPYRFLPSEFHHLIELSETNFDSSLIVHTSALLYITPDYMKPAEMISMSFFRNWIKTGKKIEAKKMMKE